MKLIKPMRGIYSYFYEGDRHSFYVKVGYSKDIRRRLAEHKLSNPLLREGPTCTSKLADFDTEAQLHNLFRECFEEVAPEHYKLSVNDALCFEDTFQAITEKLDSEWQKARIPLTNDIKSVIL